MGRDVYDHKFVGEQLKCPKTSNQDCSIPFKLMYVVARLASSIPSIQGLSKDWQIETYHVFCKCSPFVSKCYLRSQTRLTRVDEKKY